MVHWFDHFDFPVNDLSTKIMTLRCNSFSDLYIVHPATTYPPSMPRCWFQRFATHITSWGLLAISLICRCLFIIVAPWQVTCFYTLTILSWQLPHPVPCLELSQHSVTSSTWNILEFSMIFWVLQSLISLLAYLCISINIWMKLCNELICPIAILVRLHQTQKWNYLLIQGPQSRTRLCIAALLSFTVLDFHSPGYLLCCWTYKPLHDARSSCSQSCCI